MNTARKVHRRRRKQGECARPLLAIRNQCLECMGYDAAEVEHCTSPGCWLYPYRFGYCPNSTKIRGRSVDGGMPTGGGHGEPGSEHRIASRLMGGSGEIEGSSGGKGAIARAEGDNAK